MFKNLYICIGALKTSLLDGYRRIILGCLFLKGLWHGQTLAVVSRYANNHVHLIGWGVFRSKSTET